MKTRPLDVRRVLTTTPLARQHQLRLEGKATRKVRPIPVADFDRRQFPQPALDLALDSFTKTAVGEYGAVQLYAQLTSEMALAGLPFDLITASASVCTDEARHADYALQMARAVTGDDVIVRVDTDDLKAPWRKVVSLEDIDAAMLHVAAVSETIACALVSESLERATDRTSHAFYANLAADEVHHARLGWYYLSWRSPRWTRAERQRLADRMARNVVGIERRFWFGRDAPASADAAARALGMIDSETRRAAVRHVMETEIVPALDSFGLGASHAWRMREAGGKRGHHGAEEDAAE